MDFETSSANILSTQSIDNDNNIPVQTNSIKKRHREDDTEIKMDEGSEFATNKEQKQQNTIFITNTLELNTSSAISFIAGDDLNRKSSSHIKRKIDEDDGIKSTSNMDEATKGTIDDDDADDEDGEDDVGEEMKHGIFFKNLAILLVDDSAIIRKMLATILKKEGHNVVDAENGLDCLVKLKEYRLQNAVTPFDVILMDIQMPVMDGMEATRQLREELEFKKSIIALSSFCDSETVENIMAAGADGFIPKPFNLKVLYKKLLKLKKRDGRDLCEI